MWVIAWLGFIFISIFGTINHFLYDFFGKNNYAAYFFAVNESTWEHMKLVVFPSLVWLVISLFLSSNSNILIGNFLGLVTILIMIPLLFYLLNFIFGKSSGLVNILIFYVSVFMGAFVNNCLLNMAEVSKIYNIFGIVGYLIIIVLFLIFSKDPPKSGLFEEP